MARELYADSFPNLVLKVESEFSAIPVDYNNSKIMLEAINNKLI